MQTLISGIILGKRRFIKFLQYGKERQETAYLGEWKDSPSTKEPPLASMGDAAVFIKQRHIRNCFRADPSYGEGVAEALELSLVEALNADDPAHPD